jgi:hypothetical protein
MYEDLLKSPSPLPFPPKNTNSPDFVKIEAKPPPLPMQSVDRE